MKRLSMLVMVTMMVSACGGGSSGPSAAPTPTTVQVGGVWGFTSRITSVSGGECVGETLQATVGTSVSGTLQITQSGAVLTATSTSDADGSSCTYTGTAGTRSIALNGTFCSVAVITGLRCANGAIRNMELLTLGINATVTGSRASGTSAETWNVSTTRGAPVGPMTLTSSFTGTRR